ncbi:MAG: metal transporter [Crocinitomicaceae bacterium]|jgi:copper chaperone CopZ|nr:metal transporter [Crocinitomicaceae bacterium]
MKNLFFLTFVVLGLTAEAQNKAEITFEVNGVCGMCEDRIEQALDAPGIIMADWDVKSKQLTVAFKTKKIKEKAIHQLVADSGHDTDLVKAKDEVYANLHGCCKYRDGASCSGEHDEGHDDQD